jgi:hypothetical protein
LSFIFDILAIGFLLAGDHTTTTFWREVEFLQNYGHRLCLLKSPKGREKLEIFAPAPYRRGYDHNSFRPRESAATDEGEMDHQSEYKSASIADDLGLFAYWHLAASI